MSTGRFTFRLQRLLALRQMAENAASVTLGSARAAASAIHATQTALSARRAVARDTVFPSAGATRGVAELTRAALLVERIDGHVVEADKAARGADERVRDSLARLGERVQARRMLERLRERHLAEWTLGVERHEREVMDSLARRPSAPGSETTTPTNG
ncbi:MAG: hypothetical protein C0497_03045 [Gemmatimonas sp.]|nr:hypothetical protein [Gemmatimonas sp.]